LKDREAFGIITPITGKKNLLQNGAKTL